MSTPSFQPSWNESAVALLAARVGGTVQHDGWGPAVALGSGRTPEGAFVVPLTDIGLLAVSGPEAARFLHAQITNDVEHLAAGQARWAGYCSAKGRLLTTFRYWRDAEGVFLTVSRPLAAGLARRLSMFVLRAKARVSDVSDAVAVFGLCGMEVAQAAASAFGLAVPAADDAASAGNAHLVGLPPIPQASGGRGSARDRWLLVVPFEAAEPAWRALTEVAEPAGGAVWRRTEVLAGIPRIVPAVAEAFVPQMINFESVDGVNFRKGCYPGQEVVARSQYLGKLKRRMYIAHGSGPLPEPGSDVHPREGEAPCGQVVLAAPDGEGGFDLLFEAQTAAVEAGALRVGTTALTVGALPYPLKAID
jgi:folate-binding protein YgfZ